VLGDLLRDGDCLADGRSSVHEAIGKRGAFDELQHQRRHAARSFETMDGGDVHVVERRQRSRFALETGDAVGVQAHGLGQDLDRHLSAEAVSVAR
jgi:hypothetical protein